MPVIKLGDGTHEISWLDMANTVCRCGRVLAWKFISHAQLSAEANCECGMDYTAWQPVITVKVEGLDRGLN